MIVRMKKKKNDRTYEMVLVHLEAIYFKAKS